MIEEESDRKQICDMPFVKLMFLQASLTIVGRVVLEINLEKTEEGEDGGETSTTRDPSIAAGLLDDDEWENDGGGDREQPTFSVFGTRTKAKTVTTSDETMMNDDTSISRPGMAKGKKKKIKCWFIEMLRCQSKFVNSRAVDYLEYISTMNFRDYVECHEK